MIIFYKTKKIFKSKNVIIKETKKWQIIKIKIQNYLKTTIS